MFVNEQNPGEAISAVKALQKASAQGQRIYQITQANQASTLPNIHHAQATMDEIRHALNAGKQVTTHTDAVSVPGWSGAGYIIIDPTTGDGAYKISGGGNGGFILEVIQGLFNFLGLSVDIASKLDKLFNGPFGGFLEGLGNVITLLSFVINILDISSNPDCSGYALGSLIALYTVLLEVSLGAFFGLVILGPHLIFGILFMLALNFALSKIFEAAETLVCRPQE